MYTPKAGDIVRIRQDLHRFRYGGSIVAKEFTWRVKDAVVSQYALDACRIEILDKNNSKTIGCFTYIMKHHEIEPYCVYSEEDIWE